MFEDIKQRLTGCVYTVFTPFDAAEKIDYAAPRELTFEEDVRRMKAWVAERLAWLDAEIARRSR